MNLTALTQEDSDSVYVLFNRFHIKKALDSNSSVSFRDKKIVYSDFGFSTAPFSIKFKDSLGGKENLIYRNNSKPSLGFGFSYKWFSLRLSFTLPTHLRPVSKYGSSSNFDLGFEFKTKRHHYDIDLHQYQGFAIKNAYKWNDTLDKTTNPNLLNNNLQSLSLSVNTWRFINPNININILRGKTGMYLKEEQSVYIKTTINYFLVAKYDGLIPSAFQYASNSKLNTNSIGALDLGFVPGYVYVNRINNWQFSSMLGLGGVVQLKTYDGRLFLGLSPRYDLRLLCGYNVHKYFVNLITEFDNKSIRFNDLRYRQTYYTLKLVGGIRF